LIELPIQRLREDAVVPERAYAGDAGLDLSACERVEL
jgi:dUTPase